MLELSTQMNQGIDGLPVPVAQSTEPLTSQLSPKSRK